MIYLDHAATTPLLPSVKKAMKDAFNTFYGNASALHTPGHLANNIIEETRSRLARLINATPEEIIFTSGSTESNNTVINIFRGQTIAASTIEHESILLPAKEFAKQFIPINIDKNAKVCYNKEIGANKPKLISILMASNELGTIQDIAEWAKKAHELGAYLHSDMTQCLGKINIDVKKLGVDYATFSAHKIGGPIGVGALYVKKGAPFTPFMIGGSQEHNRRAGTYDTLGLVGFNAALKFIEDNNTPKLYAQNIAPLRDELAQRILMEIPGSSTNTPFKIAYLEHTKAAQAELLAHFGACWRELAPETREDGIEGRGDNNFDVLPRLLPNILNVSFAAAEGESIQLYLDAHNIYVSTGSACASGTGKPSHVLMAKTGDAEIAHSSIRFSFSLDNTKKDIDKVMSVLPSIIKRLQGISTIKTKGVNNEAAE